MRDKNELLGVGIRGAGQVAREHAKAVANNPHLYLAAVCSRREETAKHLADSFQPDARVYKNYGEMLADPHVDIVSICMPNYLHAPEAIMALEVEKHLVLEKPAAVNRDELARLKDAAEKSNSRTVVSFLCRWHPQVKNIRGVLAKQAIGEIYYAEVDYWHGIKPSFASYEWIRKKEFAAGAMITGGCHAADLARYLKGEVSEVFAYSHRVREDFDYPTTLVSSVRFADGSIGKLSASLEGVSFPYQMNIDLLGTKGAIRDNRLFSTELFPAQDHFTTISTPTLNSGEVEHHPFQQEIDNLVDNILHDEPVLSDVEDACRSMAVVIAIEESAATGKPVAIPQE